MLVARVLVPVDVEVAPAAGGTERPRHDITLGAPAVAVYGSQAGSFAPRKELLAEAMLENSPTRALRRTADFIVSATAQTIFLTGLLLLPLYFTEAIDIHQFNKTLLAAPLPPAPPLPPASLAAVRPAAPKRNAASLERHFVAPRVIPRQVARVIEEPGGNELGSLTLPGEGVPRGLAGGVIGGALLGPACSSNRFGAEGADSRWWPGKATAAHLWPRAGVSPPGPTLQNQRCGCN